MVISLLVTVLVAEHGYWVLDRALAALSERVRTAGEIDVRKEEFSVRRRYLQNIGLGGGQGLEGDQAEVGREKTGGEDVIGFWSGKGVDSTVAEARQLFSKSWEKRKVQ